MPGYYVESEFEHKGFPCKVVLMEMGHRCGYVGVTEEHPFFGKHYDKLQDIDCHGGLTYSREYLLDDHSAGTWWLGFDCMHYSDAPDVDALRCHLGGNEVSKAICDLNLFQTQRGAIVRTKEYVEMQCREIAEQLAETAVPS